MIPNMINRLVCLISGHKWKMTSHLRFRDGYVIKRECSRCGKEKTTKQLTIFDLL